MDHLPTTRQPGVLATQLQLASENNTAKTGRGQSVPKRNGFLDGIIWSITEGSCQPSIKVEKVSNDQIPVDVSLKIPSVQEKAWGGETNKQTIKTNKQNKTKQNKTKENKTKQNKTKQNKQTNQPTNKHTQQKTPHWVKHLTTPSKGVQGLPW